MPLSSRPALFLKKLWRYFYLFFKASRVKTWPISLVPVVMSSALAFKDHGHFFVPIFCLSLLAILLIQIAVNILNDAFDGQEGLDSKERLGPKRLLGSKLASFKELQLLAGLALFLAGLCAIPLVWRGGPLIFIMGFLSVLACYFYTGSRYSLLKLGLSEISAVLFFGFFIVFGVYYLQSLQFSKHLPYLALPCGLWSLTFLLINHLRDFEGDKKKGRKHLVTLYGPSMAFLFVVLGQAFIYLLAFYWLDYRPKVGGFFLLLLPLSVVLLYRLGQAQEKDRLSRAKIYNQSLGLASLIYSLFALLVIYALLA